uniref:Uncharacterized protein n=1 Tax=viral metagenome TaxID=1070528 RepID=A0A6M3IHM2_9ZZZZ
MPNDHDFGTQIAEAHVTWFLEAIRPLLIDHMVHGFKHGINYQKEKFNQEIQPTKESD